jgi:hypothetical protein
VIPNLSAVLIFHIAAGSVGLLSGGTALFVRKGAWLHRRAGTVFFTSMLLMSTSGMVVAVLKPAAAALNVVIGVLTFYLVATSWVTVVRGERETGLFEIVALLVALAAGAGGLIAGFAAADSATGGLDGIPAYLYFVFGSVAVLAGLLDVSVLVRGGVSGAQRIARHLWRMCFALFVAAIAFFVGQGAKIFPQAVRETQILVVPVILVLALMLFWLFRVLLTNWYRRRGSVAPPQPQASSVFAARARTE